jgi:hypothetical protein
LSNDRADAAMPLIEAGVNLDVHGEVSLFVARAYPSYYQGKATYDRCFQII